MWCSTMATATPESRTSPMISVSPSTSSAETPAMGSSRSRTFGSEARAMASSSFLRSPCERSRARVVAFPGIRTRSRRVSTSCRSPSRPGRATRNGENGAEPLAWTARCTFSPAVSPSKSAEVWKDRANPSRARRVADRFVTSSPPSRTDPVVGRVTPLRMLTSEDLPAPLGPMMPSSSPAPTSRETSSRIWAPPIFQPMASPLMTGVVT